MATRSIVDELVQTSRPVGEMTDEDLEALAAGGPGGLSQRASRELSRRRRRREETARRQREAELEAIPRELEADLRDAVAGLTTAQLELVAQTEFDRLGPEAPEAVKEAAAIVDSLPTSAPIPADARGGGRRRHFIDRAQVLEVVRRELARRRGGQKAVADGGAQQRATVTGAFGADVGLLEILAALAAIGLVFGR